MTASAPQPENDAMTSFASEYYKPLFRFAMSRSHDDALAQDLVQETFCKLLEAVARRPEKRAEILKIEYAITTCINTLRDHYRKSAREGRRNESFGQRMNSTRVGIDPGSKVSEYDNRERFMSSLPRRQQQVHFLEKAGYEPAEIGEILDLDEATVRNYRSIIRKRWKKWRSDN